MVWRSNMPMRYGSAAVSHQAGSQPSRHYNTDATQHQEFRSFAHDGNVHGSFAAPPHVPQLTLNTSDLVNTTDTDHQGYSTHPVYTPSPSDTTSPTGHAHWQLPVRSGRNTEQYHYNTPVDSPQELGSGNYHGEMQNMMYRNVSRPASTQPTSFDAPVQNFYYVNSAYAHSMSRQSSFDSVYSNGATTHTDESQTTTTPANVNHQTQWQDLPRGPSPAQPMPPAIPTMQPSGFHANRMMAQYASVDFGNGNPSSFDSDITSSSWQTYHSSYGSSHRSPMAIAYGNGLGSSHIPLLHGTQAQYAPMPTQATNSHLYPSTTHLQPPQTLSSHLSAHGAGYQYHSSNNYFTGTAPGTYITHPALSSQGGYTVPPDACENRILDDLKQRGMSYKEIKEVVPAFRDVPESTLRGRLRTYLKPREARVRRPEWTPKDDELLREAVVVQIGEERTRQLRQPDDLDAFHERISWKDASKYIFDNGGSYKFAFATAKKRFQTVYLGKQL